MAPPPSLGRCSASHLRRPASFAFAIAFLGALVMITASARSARADGAKQGGEVAGVLATESKPMEAPRPKAKTTANAKPSRAHAGGHAGHAKPHHGARPAKAGSHAKTGSHVKAAKAKPAKGAGKAAPARRGPKLRA